MEDPVTPPLVGPDVDRSHEALHIGDGKPHVASLFSMHSRGVLLLERHTVCNLSEQVISLGRQWRDVGSSFLAMVLLQTWTTLFAVLLSIMSISFFAYGPVGDEYALDLSLTGFIIVLPTVGNAYMAFRRREEALRQLSVLKSRLLWVSEAARQGSERDSGDGSSPGHNAILQTTCELLESMRSYFSTPRFYATQYPYTGTRRAMGRIAQERVQLLRHINACFLHISRSTQGGNKQLEDAHLAFELLSNIKEFRLPQALRALTRVGCTVVVPVFVGPFWASFYKSTSSFAFALLVGTLLNAFLVAMLNVAIDLEDPFDNQGLDIIYIDEPFNEMQQNMYLDIDAEMATPWRSLTRPSVRQSDDSFIDRLPSASGTGHDTATLEQQHWKQQPSHSRMPPSQQMSHSGMREKLRVGSSPHVNKNPAEVPLSTEL